MAPPLTRRRRKAQALAVAPPAPSPAILDPADRLSRLPEEILVQILSFLPAQEAVRTCVLARKWRHLWKSTRGILITALSVREVREFVDRLLCVCLDNGLDDFEIRINPVPEGQDADTYEFEIDPYLEAEDIASLIRWICRVLECQIQTLRVDISTYGYFAAYLKMSDDWLPLVSRHLTRMELTGIKFDCRCLNLDGCPALEHLEIKSCDLSVISKMTSPSLKRLVITSCWSYGNPELTQLCVPSLVSLWLEAVPHSTPQLGAMPELVGAKVKITAYMHSHVVPPDVHSDEEEDSYRHHYIGQKIRKCLVLEGLAQARDLMLIAHNSTSVQFIFRRI